MIVISIHIDIDDLLPLQCVSLLRAGDYDIKPGLLEIDTYHKLNNKHYRWVLDQILSSFFASEYFVSAYKAIADPSWPNVGSLAEYQNLPLAIRQECESQHHFQWLVLDENQPHCPRNILREFFEIGFRHPEKSGFLTIQNKRIHTECQSHSFPFSAFYDTKRFMAELEKIALLTHSGFDASNTALLDLHQDFLSRQPYKFAKKYCDELICRKRADPDYVLPDIDVVQEAYILSQLTLDTVST